MAQLNFNAREVDPAAGFDPVPAGWYPVNIIESEIKENSARTGHYLEMKAKIISGDHMNRQLFIRLNLDNPNKTAVRIAQEHLSAICHAVGVLDLQDSTQLHGLPFEIKVTVKPADGQYEASNEVKGFRSLEGGGQAAGSQQSTNEPSWANKKEEKPKPAPKEKPAPATKKRLEMIDTEFTYEEWIETGRSDDDLVEEGIAKWVEDKPAPAKKAPAKKAPAKKTTTQEESSEVGAPTGSSQDASAGDADDESLPPWMRK